MASFKAIKKISLEGAGEGWNSQCYISFYAYTLDDFKRVRATFKSDDVDGAIKEAQEKDGGFGIAEDMIKLHEELFVEGKGFDDDTKQIADIAVENVRQIMMLPGVAEKIQRSLIEGDRLKE